MLRTVVAGGRGGRGGGGLTPQTRRSGHVQSTIQLGGKIFEPCQYSLNLT